MPVSRVLQLRRMSRQLREALAPASGETIFDKTLRTLGVGDGATIGGYLLKKWGYAYPVSPPLITADQNDYAPADIAIAETLLLSSDAKRSITGLSGGGLGRCVTLVNRGAFDITLVSASPNSTAANRFSLDAASVVLRPRSSISLQYSVADSRWMRSAGGDKFSTIPEELLLAGVLTPPQMVANQNDYAPIGVALASTLRLWSAAPYLITGLVDPRDGVVKMIDNVGAQPITLKNADAGSSAANRFDFGADITLLAKQAAIVRYDGSAQRWRLIATTAGAAVAAGAVTAQTLSASALGAAVSMVNGAVVESRAGGALTFSVKTAAGGDPSPADPVHFVFPDGVGGYVLRSVTAALAVTLSSGSSLGFSAGVPGRVWIGAIDDAGVVRLGIVNCSTQNAIFAIDEEFPINATAEGGAGAADSAGVVYSAVAIAGKYWRFIARADYEDGVPAAGNWSVAPSRIVLVGPGSKRPGSVVQTVRSGSAGVNGPTTTTVFVNSSSQVILRPRSACNLVKYSSCATVEVAQSACFIIVALFRKIGAGADVQIGVGLYNYSSSGGDLFSSGGHDDIDFPGTTADVTYTVRFRGTSGANVFYGSNGQNLIVEELMG